MFSGGVRAYFLWRKMDTAWETLEKSTFTVTKINVLLKKWKDEKICGWLLFDSSKLVKNCGYSIVFSSEPLFLTVPLANWGVSSSVNIVLHGYTQLWCCGSVCEPLRAVLNRPTTSVIPRQLIEPKQCRYTQM